MKALVEAGQGGGWINGTSQIQQNLIPGFICELKEREKEESGC